MEPRSFSRKERLRRWVSDGWYACCHTHALFLIALCIAAALTEQALQYAEEMGYTVIPSCSYVERYMERHQRHAAKLDQ